MKNPRLANPGFVGSPRARRRQVGDDHGRDLADPTAFQGHHGQRQPSRATDGAGPGLLRRFGNLIHDRVVMAGIRDEITSR